LQAVVFVPLFEKVPAGHVAQAVSAVDTQVVVSWPGPQAATAVGLQGVQAAAPVPVTEKVPAAQSWHTESAVAVHTLVELPGPHEGCEQGVQAPAPAAGEKPVTPGWQAVQAVSPAAA